MLPSPKHYLLTLFYLTIFSGSAFGSFIAIAPNEFRPGWPLVVSVTAHKNAKDRIFVNVVLRPSDDKIDIYGGASDFVSPGETKLFTLQVSEIVLAPQSTATLSVSSTGAAIHSSEKTLTYNPTSSLVFVETDKAIYKPGQKVHIRVVHTDKSLRPINKPLTVTVLNPKDSKLEEFKSTASNSGVVEKTYTLLQSASLGKWKIQVKDDAHMVYTKEFTVEEYVLPKFSVAVTADPGFIILEDKNAGSVITVEALYTHGKAVQGNCVLILAYEPVVGSPIRIQSTKQLSPSGKTVFADLEWQRFSRSNSDADPKVTVTASVTDETGRTEAGQTIVRKYRYRSKVEILPQSTNVFRLGIPAEIFIRVSDQSGNPLDKPKVSVDVTLPGLKTATAELSVPEGQTDVSYQFTPELNPGETAHQHWRWYGAPPTVKVTLVSDLRINTEMKVHMYEAQNNSAIRVVPPADKILRVGETIQYKILKNSGSTEATVSYLVISQGSILTAGVLVDDLISITPTLAMCPQAKLFVYMIVGTEATEVVADAIDLPITGCFAKEVDVSFDAAKIRSGSDSIMKVSVNRLDGSNSMPGIHSVYYLGIDKSLALLQGRTDLNKDEVLSVLSSLNLKRSPGVNADQVPYTTGSIMEGLGLTVFTTAHIIGAKKPPRYMGNDDRIVFKSAGASPRGDRRESQKISKVETVEKAQPAPVTTKVRKHFPETWLWGHGKTDEEGHFSHAVTLPDTITTWLVSAFAINHEGLAVGRGPFELTAFQIFFLTMNLPYSIKRGEIFVLRITVFNYRPQDVKAIVKLASSTQFSVVDYQEEDEWFNQTLEMSANRASSVEFKINATEIGLIDLHVVAEDVEDGMKDEVNQKLLVKPEGEMRSRAITRVLLLKSETSLSDTFVINWPEDKIVPQSKKVEVKVTGIILGQSLSNLHRLVSVPFGCGEQNMITTVPNIYGLTYIQSTDSANPTMQTEMITNMKTGYQRQVDMYRHKDGSYSAWGEKTSFHRVSSGTAGGSVWLTSFVLKSFSKASKFITVDSTILSSAADFLSKKQDKSGAFVETGQVFHQEMQAGTGSGPSLTIYVLISLLEANDATGGHSLLHVKTQIDLAVGYVLEILNRDSVQTSNNRYMTAMAAYALSLMSDPSVNPVLDQLLAVVAGPDAPWEVKKEQPKPTSGFYYRPMSTSYDIETAAYYLLALTRLKRLGEGVEIMKWIQSQQNSNGGYYSTQDTVMALQALSEFGVAFKSSPSVSLVNIRDPESGQSFNVSMEGSRASLLHTVELPEETKSVDITATGPVNSSCVVKVVYTYYTLAGDDDGAPAVPEVSVYIKTKKVSSTVHKVEACVQSSKTLKYKGMFVTTLTLPSGEEAFDDQSTILTNNLKASKVEIGEGLVHFYMNEAPGDGYCLHALVERQMEFEVQKPGSAKIYAYYEPDTAQEVSLSLNDSACFNDECSDGVVLFNVANILLTVFICTLVTLLICM